MHSQWAWNMYRVKDLPTYISACLFTPLMFARLFDHSPIVYGSIALIAVISSLTCNEAKWSILLLFTIWPRLCAFLNKGMFDSRLKSSNSWENNWGPTILVVVDFIIINQSGLACCFFNQSGFTFFFYKQSEFTCCFNDQLKFTSRFSTNNYDLGDGLPCAWHWSRVFIQNSDWFMVHWSGLLIFRAVAEPRISSKSATSREIHKNTRNPAKFARNLSKYMSAQHIWKLSWLLGLLTGCKLANLPWNFVTAASKQHPKTTRRSYTDVAKNWEATM